MEESLFSFNKIREENMNLGEKILTKEIKKGIKIARKFIKKELKKNPKFKESDLMLCLFGIIAARALIMLFAEMANFEKGGKTK